MAFYNKKIGIDLGTVNTLISYRGKIVLNEPSVVAIDDRNSVVIAVGREAYAMMGRTPRCIRTVHPVCNGVISDFDLAEKMLTHFIRRVLRRKLVKSTAVVGVTAGSTAVERRAVIDVTGNAGNKDIVAVEESIAAALGAKLPINEATGQMIVDIGGGSVDASVLSMGSVVCSATSKSAGIALDEAIAHHVKRRHSIIIGNRMAEELKKAIVSVCPVEKTMVVSGRHQVTGLPAYVEVASDEFLEPVLESVREVLGVIRQTLEVTPPELAADILQNGIHMTGGGSLLAGLAKHIEDATGLQARLVDDPLTAVASGMGTIIDRLKSFKREQVVDRRLA